MENKNIIVIVGIIIILIVVALVMVLVGDPAPIEEIDPVEETEPFAPQEDFSSIEMEAEIIEIHPNEGLDLDEEIESEDFDLE